MEEVSFSKGCLALGDADVYPLIFQESEYFHRMVRLESNAQRKKLPLKIKYQRRKRIVLHTVYAGNGKSASSCAILQFYGLVLQQNHTFGNIGKGLAGWSNDSPRLAFFSLEELYSQLLFQKAESFAYR